MAKTKQLLGVNTFGIRMRHQILEKWLNESQSIYYVLENLSLANFDPEFSKRYELEILRKFNMQFTTNLKPANSKINFLQRLFNHG